METIVRESSLLAATLVASAAEITDFELIQSPASPISPIGARLSVLEIFSSVMVLRRQPPFAFLDLPLEMEFSFEKRTPGIHVAAAAALCLSTHAQLLIRLERGTLGQNSVVAPLLVHSTDKGWSARALLRPSSWSDSGSVVLDSISIAGRPLPCIGLPAITRVGYNHAPAAEGAVFAAAKAGDVSALRSALSAGGSTEEASPVSACD